MLVEKMNRRIVLTSHPKGMPHPTNFRLETVPVPDISDGHMLLRTVWLSLDPYMRGQMDTGPSYSSGVALGDPMRAEVVARVVVSRHPAFAVGNVVLAYAFWQDYTVSDGTGLRRLDSDAAPLSTALGVLGMPGMTAWVGLQTIAKPRPGETLVVAAASGAVGSSVAQIAKIKGCRVVGIAGGAAKCRYLSDELHLDVALDHRAPSFSDDLRAACPEGIDIYFENVGGRVLQAILPLLNTFARIPVCGVIAHYNDDASEVGSVGLVGMMRLMISKRVLMQGFLVDDHTERTDEFLAQMGAWVSEGRVRYREDITPGLENAPGAFIGMLQGENFGKTLIRVED
jgi:NADPH-dependent curcumin reductase CurA